MAVESLTERLRRADEDIRRERERRTEPRACATPRWRPLTGPTPRQRQRVAGSRTWNGTTMRGGRGGAGRGSGLRGAGGDDPCRWP
jgi:hypothetical protein